jgi:hypothetical protein
LVSILAIIACENKEIPTGTDCSQTPLITPTVTVTNASSCTASDGQVSVLATGGVPPYQYSFNNGTFQNNPVFTGLSAGMFPIEVKDSRGCTIKSNVTVLATGSTLSASASTAEDTECFDPHNGSITVTPSGGTPPYEVKLGGGAFGSALSFTALEKGNYTVVVKDASNCTITLGVEVARGDTGVSFASDIMPIIQTNCAVPSCHAAGSAQPAFTSYAAISARAAAIKLRTGNGSMPPGAIPDLSADEIQRIACWVDDGAKNN